MKRYDLALTFFVSAALLSPDLSVAQLLQQGPKLVGTGAVGNGLQGSSVSLSADGNTAIIGAPSDNNDVGAAWVWTRKGRVWTQQSTKLTASDVAGKAQQGTAVSLSADGNTALVGGDGDNNLSGAAWVWTRSGGVWSQQGTKLVGSGVIVYAQQGNAVSLSADGNTALVGGFNDNFQVGAAWVWTRTGGVWTQQGGKLVGSVGVGLPRQGWSVSLSADGNTAIVGGWGDNFGVGAAWVWTRSGGVWTQQWSKLVGSSVLASTRQGWSVSLSANGDTAIVGGNSDSGNAGAWVWTRIGGVWNQQAQLLAAGVVGTTGQGSSVSLSADGNTAIIGAPGDNGGAGAAWVWTRSGGVWAQQSTKLAGAGSLGSAQLGVSALSADANTVLVGGSRDNNGIGAAWVFVPAGEAGQPRRRAVSH